MILAYVTPALPYTPFLPTHTSHFPQHAPGLFSKPLSRLEVKSKDFGDRGNWVLILFVAKEQCDFG